MNNTEEAILKDLRIQFNDVVFERAYNGASALPMLEDFLKEVISRVRESTLEEVEKEVRRLGDTSDYPEWKGAAGINVGLIPKEKVLSFLAKSNTK